MANRTERRHRLTGDERRAGQAKRSPEERAASARRGWEKRRAGGGSGLTHEEQVAGAKRSGDLRRGTRWHTERRQQVVRAMLEGGGA